MTQGPVVPLPPSGRQVDIWAGSHRATVVEVGGGLRSYTVGDRALLDGYPIEEMCSGARGQLLIPWPNRLENGEFSFGGKRLQVPLTEPQRGNAIHGLTRWSSWESSDQQDACVTFRHHLLPQPGWPFPLLLEARYTLGDKGLTVAVAATNEGREPCPFGLGAHPYLTAGTPRIDSATLQAPGGISIPVDDRMLPIGHAPVEGTSFDFRGGREIGDVELDLAYTDLQRRDDGLAWVELRAPDGRGAGLWMDESFRFVELFTGDGLPPQQRRRGLGVEPMTCPPNAFRSGEGLIVLEPGERFCGSWGVCPLS